MFYFDYPKVKQSLGIAALQDAYPTLFLNSCADIHGANPLALWLWGALESNEVLHPERLLGINAFTMITSHFQRIPVDLNKEVYTKLSAMIRRQDERRQARYYAPFIAAMQADPALAQIYQSAPHYPEREWEYLLKVTHPDQPETLLEFQTSIYRLERDGGFLVVYYPQSSTVPVIEEINSRLMEKYDKAIFMLPDEDEQEHENRAKMLYSTGYHAYFRSYYPRLIQDELWYLTGENKAHNLMMGMSVVNMHFFEIFLAPIVRYFMGSIQESTAPRALKYFDMFTSPYMRESHDLHERYEQTMQLLSRLDGFGPVLAYARGWPIRLNVMAQVNLITESDEPFYTCRVILPWRFNPDVHLQFKSMVRFLFEEGLVPQPDRRKCEVTLVPENYETDIAMLLLPLLSYPPSDDAEGSASRQFLWLLALLRVANEAIATREDDLAWEPEQPFARIFTELKSSHAQTQTDEIIAEIRTTIELIERTGKASTATLLELLRSYMVTGPPLKPLSDFLTQEAEIEQRAYSVF